jgi:serine protease Do
MLDQARLIARSPIRWHLAIAAMALALSTMTVIPAAARAAPESFADLAQKLLPAVVNISTTQTARGDQNPSQRRGPEIPQFPPGSPFEEFFKDFFDRQQQQPRGERPQPRRQTSLGSGFIVDSSGLVVTNNHVIADADEINVILHDDTTLKATLVGRDPKTDLAVLRVKSDKPLSAVVFGDSDKVRVGDWVIAIGNPFGLGGTVTAGIVSARQRDINAGPYDDFIQTDASINRGNSGGPMFNMAGEVIGINTAIFSPTGGSVGIGFAVPAAMAKPVVDQLKTTGKVRRGWLGVRIQSVTDELAETFGLGKARGALVASISDGGPADKAGIQAGDVVIKFDNRDVPDMRRLPRIVAETPVDKTVDAVVWRKGKQVTVKVKVGELDESAEQQLSAATPGPAERGRLVESLGLELAPITAETKSQFSLPEAAKGVVVLSVKGTGAAAQRGLKPGDIIVEVAQEEVTNPSQVEAKVKEAKAAGRKSILLLVDRKGDLQFVALRIDQG